MSHSELQDYLNNLKLLSTNNTPEYCQFTDETLPITISPLFDTLIEELIFENTKYCFEQPKLFTLDDEGITKKSTNQPLLHKCKHNSDIIIIPITESKESLHHRTLVIIDNVKKEIEHFDSRGSNEYTERLETLLYNELKNTYPDYNYISSSKFCPNIGPQLISNDLLCTIWRFLYFYLRMNFPDIDRHLIVHEISIEPRKIINGYYCTILQYFVKQYPNFIKATTIYLDLYKKINDSLSQLQNYLIIVKNSPIKNSLDKLIVNELLITIEITLDLKNDIDSTIKDYIRTNPDIFTWFVNNAPDYRQNMSFIDGGIQVLKGIITNNPLYITPTFLRRPPSLNR